MGRVINTDLPTNKRKQICHLMAFAISNLEEVNGDSEKRNDLIAFIVLSLNEIEKTIIQTTSPWEKRGYFVKSEKFQQEWVWVSTSRNKIMALMIDDGWKKVPDEINEIKKILNRLGLTKRNISSEFWKGAYRNLLKLSHS